MPDNSPCRSCPLGLALLALASVAPCQARTLVLPPGHTARAGNTTHDGPVWDGWRLIAHTQYGYSAADFPAGTFTLRAIAFRAAPKSWFTLTSQPVTLTVHLSSGLRAPSAFVRTFASNEGKDRTLVASDTSNLPPARPNGGVQPFVLRIPFARPFTFAPGQAKSLVVDILTENLQVVGTSIWPVDAVMGSWGGKPLRTLNHANTTCKDSAGNRVAFVAYNPETYPGGSYAPVYIGAPRSTVGVASVGFKGAGGTWGGARLPIALPGAPGCAWATDAVFSWSFTTDASGWGRVPELRIPYDPKLAGGAFYDQPVFVDKKANRLGLVTGPSYRWLLGSAPHTALLFKLGIIFKPGKYAQTLWRGRAPILQLSY